jgi:hypothetical protein
MGNRLGVQWKFPNRRATREIWDLIFEISNLKKGV